jgi:hypothetical protein
MREYVSARIADGDLEFDTSFLFEHATHLNEDLHKYVLSLRPKFTYPVGELGIDKLDVRIALKELVEIAEDLAKLDTALADVKSKTTDFSQAMGLQFGYLNLPWKLKVYDADDGQLRMGGEDLDRIARRPPPASPRGGRSPRRFRKG